MSVKDAINQAITLLDSITVDADEDSALGMAFVSGRISEDGFYSTKNDLERSLKELDPQLVTAHRAGWEQAKKQADSLLLDLVDVVLESKPVVQSARRAIAAMEYGGEK